MPVRPRTISLVSRVMLAIFIAGLLPLVGITLSAIDGFRAARNHAVGASTTALDAAALAPLQQRTVQTAQELATFLDFRADDTRAAAQLEPQLSFYMQFVTSRDNRLWYVTGTPAAPVEQHQDFPMFRELVSVDSTGRLLAHIVDNMPRSDPGDPSLIASYLSQAKTLAPDMLSVSHLTRLYVPRPANVSERLPGADYGTFDGVYRFVAARRTADGAFDGAVMLALDARHVMEFVVHILPTKSDSAVWPDVSTGDYATLFDDEGWTLANPNLSTVRGNDAKGQPVPAATAATPSAERDSLPFNALLGGWADPNLPAIFNLGRSGKTGVMLTRSQQSAHEAVTYAPIPFAEGAYQSSGVFGVLTIGANTDEFHEAATTVATAIDTQFRRLQISLVLVGILGVGLLAVTGVAVSRMLVRPLSQLTAAARRLEEGEFDEAQLTAIRHRRFSDEVTVLANVFAEMGRQVVKREQQLRTRIAELHIQVDSRRRQEQVDEITETDYFRNLRETATRLRSRTPNEPPPEGGPQ